MLALLELLSRPSLLLTWKKCVLNRFYSRKKAVQGCKVINVALLFGMSLFAASNKAHSYEAFFTVGYQKTLGRISDRGGITGIDLRPESTGYHLAIGLHKPFGESQRHWFGVALDYDDILESSLLGYRALDYLYQPNDNWRLGAFFGAASLDSGLPQNGYYTGASLSRLNAWSQPFDAILELRFASGLARDRRLPGDPQSTSPDIFLNYVSVALGFNYRF